MEMCDEIMSAFETPRSVHQWCTALGLNPRKVAAVGPMVPIVKEEFIYQVLDREQMFKPPKDSHREIDRDRVPPDIDAESEGPWKIVLLDMFDDADELTSQVKAPESVPINKTLFDSPAEKSQVKRCPSCESMVSKGSHHSSGGWLDTPEIVSALGQLTDQLSQLAWNGNFKRLKVFSGTDPVYPGEKSLESWRDSTVVSVTFGPVESSTEMIYRFHSTFQKEKKDLSAYLVRLEQGLRLLFHFRAYRETPADAKLLVENKKLHKELQELKAQLSERAKPQAEAKKVPKCYRCGKLGHIQPNCPVPDEGETQSALCKVPCKPPIDLKEI
ncbi:hypothetical protein XELAEV_18037206mg [Xenopus laevis]|uniref:CCHC-type domain-containing protein n=1 Tax=Xenopus laevis TaxID=8355 RepID=A0A974CBQ5_XENLA|nr:hypothetical protein XELAEV_18037206mg [Xenopus laevis]